MGNLPLDPGECAVNVQWYNQRDIGSPLEYTVDRTNPYPIVYHNHTLVLGGFNMVQINGNAVRVPQQRTIKSQNDEFGYNIPKQNLQTREGDRYRKEFGNVYRLSEEVRDRETAQCRQWAGQQVTFMVTYICKAVKKKKSLDFQAWSIPDSFPAQGEHSFEHTIAYWEPCG